MNRPRTGLLKFLISTALAVSLPAGAWSVELQNLPFTSPSAGLSINLPLTDQASAVGVVTSMRPSLSAGGSVLYGDLTGDVVGTFMVWYGGSEVESVVSLDSGPLNVMLSVPPDGYSASMNFGKISVSVETAVVSHDTFSCDFSEPDPLGSSKTMPTTLSGIPEDQGGAADPSPHIFYDLLDYQAGSKSVPLLNSYPFLGNQNHGNTPRAVIYLDFNGDHVSRGISTYSTPGFVDPGNHILTSADVCKIEDAFQVVAERLRPFDINVTTDLSVFLDAPENMRGWAFVTNDVEGGRAGTSGLGRDKDPVIVGLEFDEHELKPGMIAIHEIGHLLGVEHFGPSPSARHPSEYDGHHLGAPGGSCPLVGAAECWNTPTGYRTHNAYKVYQWTQGEFLNSTEGGNGTGEGIEIIPPNFIDSLHLIDQVLGSISYRADDRANSAAAAKTLVSNAEFDGLIEDRFDVDVFKVEAFQTGPIIIDVLSLADHPELIQSDGCTGKSMAALDIYAELRDSLDNPVAVANPTDSLDAAIVYPAAAAGTYYLHISGTHLGEPLNDPPTGYTDYGSIGSYRVSGTYPTDPGARPDLDIISFTYGVSNTTVNGPWWWEITPMATIKNIGDSAASASQVITLVQQNGETFSLDDIGFNSHDVLEPGQQTTIATFFFRDLTLQQQGDYLVGARVDATDAVTEDDESNNEFMIDPSHTAHVTDDAADTPPTPVVLGNPGEIITVSAGEPITFAAQTTDPQDEDITYHWDFDNDGEEDASSQATPSGDWSYITRVFSSNPRVRFIRVRAESAAGVNPGLTPWSYLPHKSLRVIVNPPQ